MDKISKADKVLAYLEKNWLPLLFLALLAIVATILFSALLAEYRHNKEVHVLITTPVDSVRSEPAQPEKDAEAEWDRLKTVHP